MTVVPSGSGSISAAAEDAEIGQLEMPDPHWSRFLRRLERA